jgi:hypothetical protein
MMGTQVGGGVNFALCALTCAIKALPQPISIISENLNTVLWKHGIDVFDVLATPQMKEYLTNIGNLQQHEVLIFISALLQSVKEAKAGAGQTAVVKPSECTCNPKSAALLSSLLRKANPNHLLLPLLESGNYALLFNQEVLTAFNTEILAPMLKMEIQAAKEHLSRKVFTALREAGLAVEVSTLEEAHPGRSSHRRNPEEYRSLSPPPGENKAKRPPVGRRPSRLLDSK